MITLPAKVIARSAADTIDEWPFWYVAGTRLSPNITGEIARALNYRWPVGAVFASRQDAERLADEYNSGAAP